MSAMVILPSTGIRPAVSTLETGSHFMCERTSGENRGSMAIYQVVSHDPGIFMNTRDKIPAVNCSTGFMRMFPPSTGVIPVKMALVPQDVVKIAGKDAIFVK